MNSDFITPVNMTVYEDGSYRYVSDNEITVGQELLIKYNSKGEPITGFVKEIVEQRKSKGTFKNNIPFSSKIIFQ